MERKRATDFPQGLLDLFDHYVHGEISRRQFLDGAAKYAVCGLTGMAIWESLRPNYALAEQVSQDSTRNMRQFPHHRATAAYADISFVPQTPMESCPACLSCMRTVA
jgi:hypothetical protein